MKMAHRTTDRRTFLRDTATAGATLCGLCMCPHFGAFAAEGPENHEPIDPRKLNYCGYTCPKDCKFLEATLAGDVELKREAFNTWKLDQRYGIEFDPDTAFCYGCKAPGKPEGDVVARCTVRSCVREKKLDCCIECDELSGCDRELWQLFPTFKEQVVEMQKRYRAQG